MAEMKFLNGYEIVDEKARNSIALIKEGFVTPEMYGAVGDGVADDTEAFQRCVDAGFPICARNTYKITGQVKCVDKSLDLYGGGSFVIKSQDITTPFIYVRSTTEDKVDHVTVKGLSFHSARDNTNIYPPAGHTRPEGCRASNIKCLYFESVKNVDVEDVQFEGMENDVVVDNCTNVNVRGYESTNASISFFAKTCENIKIRDAKITLYDILSTGDHHLYFERNNGDVLIENVKLYSKSIESASYPIHFYYTDGYSAINATVRNSYIEHASCLAAVCKNGIVVENTTFVSINTDANNRFVYDAVADENTIHRFKGCTFTSLNGFLCEVSFTNKAIFDDCDFKNLSIGLDLSSSNTTITFNRCNIDNDVRLYKSGDCSFADCIIKGNAYAVYVTPETVGKNFEFYRCRFVANADGIFSVRGANCAVTAVDCGGTNEKTSKKFNYDSGNTTATYNLYHCTFPDLTFRTEGQTLKEKYNVWAE